MQEASYVYRNINVHKTFCWSRTFHITTFFDGYSKEETCPASWISYFKIRLSKTKSSELIILHLWKSGWSGFRITLNSSGIIT